MSVIGIPQSIDCLESVIIPNQPMVQTLALVTCVPNFTLLKYSPRNFYLSLPHMTSGLWCHIFQLFYPTVAKRLCRGIDGGIIMV